MSLQAVDAANFSFQLLPRQPPVLQQTTSVRKPLCQCTTSIVNLGNSSRNTLTHGLQSVKRHVFFLGIFSPFSPFFLKYCPFMFSPHSLSICFHSEKIHMQTPHFSSVFVTHFSSIFPPIAYLSRCRYQQAPSEWCNVRETLSFYHLVTVLGNEPQL